jgi:hypothetical protein
MAVAGNPLFGLWLTLNSIGALGGPTSGPVYASVVWLLFYATLVFVRMLASPPRPTDA